MEPTFLESTLAQTGTYAKGCVCIEVWIFSAEQQRLERVSVWLDPDFRQCHHGSRPLAQLFDEESPEYVRTEELAPGVGLAGILWADLERHHAQKAIQHQFSASDPMLANRSHNSATRRITFRLFGGSAHTKHGWGSRHGGTRAVPSEHIILPHQEEEEHTSVSSRPVEWRNVDALAKDSLQPYDERLNLLSQIGAVKWAAAVPFAISGHEGIVLYLKTCKAEEQVRPAQELYLRRAADWIGSAYALQGPLQKWIPMHANLAYPTESFENTTEDLTTADSKREDESVEIHIHPLPSSSDDDPVDCLKQASKKMHASITKWKGADVKPPPSMSWEEATLAASGSFVALIILTYFSTRLPEQGLVLGSFGAFTTLLFGLSSAPASQPRTAIFGQCFSMLIALAISTLPFPAYVRQSLATALAIGVMAKLGITHPPAGGAAIMLADGRWSWITMPFMLVGVLIAVFTATIFNNLSPKRQYPTAWGIQQTLAQIYALLPELRNDPTHSTCAPFEGPEKTPEAKMPTTTTRIEHHDTDDTDYSQVIEC